MGAKKVNYDKYIWEGWTVGNFITELEPTLDIIYSNNSWKKPMETKAEMKKWCMENQPHYKTYIPEVVNYFAEKYKLK